MTMGIMDSIDELPKNVYDRLEYLEFMLRFRGWVSRSDLTDRFGLGEAAATRDIRLYREFSPDNLRLNQSSKKYEFVEEGFRPVFDLPVQSALSKLRKGNICDALGISNSGGSLSPQRLVLPDVDLLATITRAISVGAQLRTDYRSVKNGWSVKNLVPHALFDNGIHWYMRACDLDKNEFRTYALTRICKVDIDKQVNELPDLKLNDFQWSRMVSLELVPHPNRKNVHQPETIEYDFKMKDGVLKLMVRAAVVGYWLHYWNVDCTEDHHLKGYNYQLWLRNHQTLYDVESRGIAPGLSTYDQD
jgi:predicted DNA-binding transcriptional regulator YafY